MQDLKIIKHRVNTVNDLSTYPSKYGAEIDIRYHNDDLILSHDPFSHHLGDVVLLSDFLKEYKKTHTGILILNLKTEGIEEKAAEMMISFKINDWFFLDMSQPYLIKYTHINNNPLTSLSNYAVRYSEYEPIEYCMSFKSKAEWIWIDYFTKSILTKDLEKKLHSNRFKICLVSPELQNHSKDIVITYVEQLRKNEILIDSVCTKYIDLWDKYTC